MLSATTKILLYALKYTVVLFKGTTKFTKADIYTANSIILVPQFILHSVGCTVSDRQQTKVILGLLIKRMLRNPVDRPTR